MITPAPSFPNDSHARGVSATRRSPGKVSRGTPMVKATSYLLTESSQNDTPISAMLPNDAGYAGACMAYGA